MAHPAASSPGPGPSDPDPGVELLWPEDHGRSAELLARGRPHLLVVPTGDPPPAITSSLHDWIRSPIDEAELRVRIDLLHARVEGATTGPWIDEGGLLRNGERWIALSDHQIALARPLVLAVGCPVPLAELQRAYVSVGGQGESAVVRRALSRLRARLAEVGVELHLLSGKAAMLERPEPT